MEIITIQDVNRQLSYENFAKLSRVRLFTQDLADTVKRIEKAVRKKCKAKRDDETNLGRNKFGFWTPPCIPFWDGAWKVNPYMDLGCWYRESWNDRKFGNIVDYFNKHFILQNDLFAWITVWFIGGRCIKFTYDPKRDSATFEIQYHQTYQDVLHTTEPIRQLSHAWHFDKYMMDSGNQLTFLTEEIKNNTNLRIDWDGGEKELSPGTITIEKLTDVSRGVELANRAIQALTPIFGQPVNVTFSVHGRQKSQADQTVDYCRSFGIKWNLMLFSEYTKGFNPFTKPELNNDERMYPVVKFERSISINNTNDEICFLNLQITVHHTPTESSLLLHTQHDYSFLEELVKESGLDVEMIREEDSYEV